MIEGSPLAMYLILAHDQPGQLARLIDRLNCPNVRFIIHIDGKSDIKPFLSVIPRYDNITFLQNRVSVFWGGFSVVEATLSLIREACKYDFRYAILLSGSDYPIKPNSAIHDFLGKANAEFINYWQLSDRPSWLYRIAFYHYLDSAVSNPRVGPVITTFASRAYHRLVQTKLASLLPVKRTFPFALTPYGGSQWWMLSRDCLHYLIKFIDENEQLVNFFRSTYVPDEMFFQTIILNSPFADRVVNQEAYREWSRNRQRTGTSDDSPMLEESSFHYKYMYWSATKGRPATLDEEDYEQLLSSCALFARKFHPVKSRRLMEMIDARILDVHAGSAVCV